MKKFMISTTLLFVFFSAINAQIEEKMRKENVVAGAIYEKNGQTIEGYIKIMGEEADPEFLTESSYSSLVDFQGNIYFIPKDVFESTPKIKSNSYKKYSPKNLSGYRYAHIEFEAVKYSDLSALGPGMIAKWIFMQRISKGKISTYYYYNPELKNKVVMYRKNTDEKVRQVATSNGIPGINMKKFWDDCPYVKEKQEKDEYKGSNLEIRLAAIDDYNKYCE